MGLRQLLIVDDSRDTQEMLSAYLSSQGFAVAEAMSGPDAIEAVKRVRPEVVLMDVGMPVMDGNEATRRIKADPENRNVIVIAVSGYAQPRERAQSLAAGCDFFITKPYDLTDLVRLVREALG